MNVWPVVEVWAGGRSVNAERRVMKVIVEWFGETGAPQGSVTLSDVSPVDIASTVRQFVAAQFQAQGNPHTCAVVTVLDAENADLLRLPPAIQPLGRFVVTHRTQGNWGNGNAF